MRFCGGCGSQLGDGSAAVGLAEARDGAQRRHMTVMFCDLVGSTPLAESLDPEDFREVLSGYQRACVRAIERFEGYTAKYVGDGLVAYFGYPRAHEDDAQRAVHAGLGILHELVALNERLREARGISLQVRIGLHTGVVVAGEMGAGGTREPLAIVGETPHVAARVESIAAPGSVVISEVTRELIGDCFETEPLGEKTLEGVSRPMRVHRVLRAIGAADRLEHRVAHRLRPMVGRDRELARLAEAWRGAKGGCGAIAHVCGEAGIGKSRLVHALREALAGQLGAEHMWQCSAHYRSSSLYPVIRFLERLLDLDRTDTTENQLEALRDAVIGAGLDPAGAVPPLADLLSIGAERRGAGPVLAPRDARSATLRALESLLIANQAGHPLLLVVEDLHWADPTTIELLERILTNVPSIPVFCVLTFRREFEPPWRQAQPALEIELGPLSSQEVRAMASAASASALEPAVLERVDSVADGVPLFVEEMLKLDLAPTATAVPPTLLGLLTERLDRLPDLADVIDTAAVLGREFERELLEALEPLDGAELEPALAQLAAQDVLRAPDATGSRLEFTHALLQEAAYERLLRSRRHTLHGRVARVLTRSFAGVAEREPEVIARHWSCAVQPAKAVGYWHAAGTRALERAAFLEAAEHFRRGFEALEAASPDPGDDLERVDFLTHRAASLQAGRGYAATGVDDAYAKARSGCERARSRERLVPVIRGQWLFHLLRGEYGTALELADEMLALGEPDDHPVRMAEGYLYGGLVHMYLANFDLAREHLDEAFARYQRTDRSDQIYEAQGDTGVMALAYNAVVLWNLGDGERSRERSNLSLQLAERIGGPVTLAQAWGMRAILHLTTRTEPAELSHWAEKTRAHSADLNIGYWRAVSSLISGWLHGRAGELGTGATRVQESLDAYLHSGSRLSVPHFYILLADLRLAAGENARALDLLAEGEEYIAASGERFSESELYRFKGRALMAGRSPDPDGAAAAYERAIAAAHAQNAKLLELRAATHFAVHQQRIGETCTVLEQLASLCGWFSQSSQLPDVVRARRLVALESAAR
ncbi:MAG TPA: adenylate/guanylate cyclase domain-containing protein [Solirubrobacteraceae bacterium]|nr:adenylate/guanylate cyclase domain-containing protein [Solirubrobacteraceae bacterium]